MGRWSDRKARGEVGIAACCYPCYLAAKPSLPIDVDAMCGSEDKGVSKRSEYLGRGGAN